MRMIFAVFILVLLPSFARSERIQVSVMLQKTPLKNQSVEVLGFIEGEEKLNLKAKTDALGLATFDVKGAKENLNLLVRSLYEGLQYYAEPIYGRPYPKKPILITVYKSSTSNESVKLKDLRIFISTVGDVLQIDEALLIENSSRFTVMGSEKTKGETLRIGLPKGAHDLRFGLGFDEQETKFDGNDILISQPFLPGFTRFAFKYRVERAALSADLGRKFSLPIEALSLASDIEGLQFSGLNVLKGPKKFTDDKMAQTYRASLENRREFSLEVSGLPLKYRTSQVLPFIAVILLLLILVPLSRKSGPTASDATRKALLKDLVLLKRLREKSLIDIEDYDRRRLKILESLIPFYEAQ